MEIAEKKETEIKASTALPSVDSSADRESDDRDRQSRDLKAGLHPLKVSSWIFPLLETRARVSKKKSPDPRRSLLVSNII